MRTPETLTAMQRAARLREQAVGGDWAQTSHATAEAPQVTTKPSSLDKARASLMSSLSERPSASASLDPRAEVEGSISILSIDDIEYYDHNPRVGANPKYDEIRASVKADNITNILTVTRRPGGVKYFPYGGGNTRLRIAKELHAQGDRRFAQLRVVVKAWRSEFDVIAAHLVENENRGDTSFWEKALGVSTFKQEYEREYSGHSLIGTELNRELAKRGMNFGVKMIQNFLFSVEYLAPVGPWLRTHDVNTVLRPKLAEYLEVTGRFDKIEEAGRLVRDYLEDTASGLKGLIERNALRDASEHVAVELDAQRVVQDMAKALSSLVGADLDRFVFLSTALAADPRLQAKDLQTLQPQRAALGAATRSTPLPGHPAGDLGGPAHHKPGTDPTAPASSTAPVQRSLAPMAGVVGGSASGLQDRPTTPAQHGKPLAPAEAGDVHDEPRSLDERRERLRDQMVQTITAVNAIVPIHDFMLRIDSMPFGFFVDLPIDLARVGDVDVSAHMEDRGMLWHFLASLSGQLHEYHWQRVADDPLMQGTRWVEARRQGAMAFARTLGQTVYAACGLVDAEHGIFELHLPANVLWALVSNSRLSPLLTRVIEIRRSLQDLEPDLHQLRGQQLRFPLMS